MVSCPTVEQLEDFLHERSPENLTYFIVEHVEICAPCRATLAMLGERSKSRLLEITHCEPDSSCLDEKRDGRRLDEFLKRVMDAAAREQTEPADSPPAWPSVAGFEILGEIGRGGMAVVYKARQINLDRMVALKMFLAGRFASPSEVQRFWREAEVVAKLKHPNIIQIHEIGSHEGMPFLSLEYVGGGSLSQKLSQQLAGGPFSPEQAAALVRTLADSMKLAHRSGVVHRDLKPGNVLLTEEGTPKISDFGLAKRIDAPSAHSESGQILGSPGYMAPEQASGTKRQIGPAADVHALGAILYELLTGQPPFRGSTAFETLKLTITDEPMAPSCYCSNLPLDLETICLRCLAKEASKRYRDAGELADDLRRFQQHEPILARRTPTWERALKWRKRHPVASALITAAFVSVFTLFGVVLTYTAQVQHLADDNAKKAQDALTQRDLAKKLERTANELRRLADEQKAAAEIGRYKAHTEQQRMGLTFTQQFLAQQRLSAARETLLKVPESRRGWEWHYLLRQIQQGPQLQNCLGAHDWGVTAMCLSPDESLLLSSGQDGWVGTTDPVTFTMTPLEKASETPTPSRRYHVCLPLRGYEAEHPEGFPSVCFVANGKVAAGASLRGSGVLWDLDRKKRTEVVRHAKPLYAASASANGATILFGDSEGQIIFFEQASSRIKKVSLGTSGIITMQTLPGRGWVVGQEDGTVTLLDQRADPVAPTYKVPGPVWALSVTPDGHTVAVGCQLPAVLTFAIDPKEMTLRPTGEFTLPRSIRHTPAAVHAVHFGRDGRRLIAGDDTGRLTGWNVRDRVVRFVLDDQRFIPLQAAEIQKLPMPMRRRVATLQTTRDGNTLYSAGQDAVLKRWSIPDTPGITELHGLGKIPRIRFDHADNDLLWISNEQGTLRLWHVGDNKERCAMQAHPDGPVLLDFAPRAGVAVTSGADKKIRFWKRDRDSIREWVKPIQHLASLRCVAISPDGELVAGYDMANGVHLWRVNSGENLRLPPLFANETEQAVRGLVAFNADGSKLAVAGPGQTFRIVSAGAFDKIEKWDGIRAAGRGGTAIAWHPDLISKLVSGDTAGRLSAGGDVMFTGTDYQANTPVAGLSFSPGGDRLAVTNEQNELFIIDPIWLGIALKLKPNRSSACSDLRFDSRGHRLAFAHVDGVITIWNAAPEQQALMPISNRQWNSNPLFSGRIPGQECGYVQRRLVGLDQTNRVWLLRNQRDQDFRTPATSVFLGHETADGYVEELLDRGTQGPAWQMLQISADDVWAIVHRKDGGLVGQTHLYHRRYGDSDSQPRKGLPLFEKPMNWGFTPQLMRGAEGPAVLLHFAFAGYYLNATYKMDAQWVTAPIGRKGDGKADFNAVGDAKGRIHAAFRPQRFDLDPHPPIYTRLLGPPWREEIREIIPIPADQDCWCLQIGPHDEPIALCGRTLDQTTAYLSVWRRHVGSGWRQSSSFSLENASLSWPVSMVCDKQGTLLFAYCNDKERRVMLATCTRDSWQSEPVWKQAADDAPWVGSATVLCDSRDQPVIVSARAHEFTGEFRVHRPAAKAR